MKGIETVLFAAGCGRVKSLQAMISLLENDVVQMVLNWLENGNARSSGIYQRLTNFV